MMPAHRFASTRLWAYRDGMLPDGEARRVRDHLAGCLECRESLAGLTAVAMRVRSSKPPAPDGLAERVIAHLDAQSAAARLSAVSCAADDVVRGRRSSRAAVARRVAREQLPRTLPLAFVIGLLVTLLKDLGALLADGLTLQTCAICGANFVVAFAVLNLGLVLALGSTTLTRRPR